MLLPLNVAGDAYFLGTVLFPNSSILVNTLGTLDGSGIGAALHVPPLSSPAVAGLVLHHAYLLDPGPSPAATSNAVPLALKP